LTVFRKLSHGVPAPGGPPIDIAYVGILYGPVPAVLILISLVSLFSYRLDRRASHAVQQQLAARAKLELHD
jgi:Na+/melibiose symporter-like transporter